MIKHDDKHGKGGKSALDSLLALYDNANAINKCIVTHKADIRTCTFQLHMLRHYLTVSTSPRDTLYHK